MSIKCSELDNMNISLDYFNSIKSVSDDLIKYFKGYKQLNQDYMKKLQSFHSNYKKKFSNTENPKTSQIISTLTSQLNKLIEQIGELLQLSIDEIDLRIREFDTFIKKKTESIKAIQKASSELNKSLNSLYNDVNKAKTNYLNSLGKTEELINKYYSEKQRLIEHENGMGKKLNENEYTLLKEQQKNQKNDMENSLKASKKLETIYKSLIDSSIKLHDKYVESHNTSTDKIKKDTCELSEEIKTLIISFMVSFKNNYKQPLSSIDVAINQFNLLKEGEETDKIISSKYKDNNLLKNISPTNYKLKSLSIIIDPNNELKNKENDKNKDTFRRQNSISRLEDGFEEMKYISDEPLIITIKNIFENFTYIDKEEEHFNFEVEEKKNRTQKYILKIINNMFSYPFSKYGFNQEKKKNPNLDPNMKYKREELSTEELLDLRELLDNHENRIIFLQKLSDYRTKGRFYICIEDYTLISKFFNIILDKVKNNYDHHSAEMVIILSQTYYLEEGTEKKYLQQSIEENPLFKDIMFWQDFLCYSINKEIMKTLKRDQKVKENKANSDSKLSNIAFSQILTLIDNMYEFNVEPNAIKEILEPKIKYYKLDDALKSTIQDVILSKEQQKAIEKEEKEKEKEDKLKQEDKKEETTKQEDKKEENTKQEDKKEDNIKKDEEKNVIKNDNEPKKEDENTKKDVNEVEKKDEGESKKEEGDVQKEKNENNNIVEEKKNEEENKINDEKAK